MTPASQIQKFLFSASPVIYQTSFFFSILEKKEFFSKLNKLCSHLINSIIIKNQNVRNRIVRRYTIEEKRALIRYKDSNPRMKYKKKASWRKVDLEHPAQRQDYIVEVDDEQD
jgi:hypothetical protein